jgi:hypothetical protein
MASKGVEQTVNFCNHLYTVIDKRTQCSVNLFPTRSHSIVISQTLQILVISFKCQITGNMVWCMQAIWAPEGA